VNPLNKRGTQAIEAAIQHANETVCATYQQDGCPFRALPCMPPSPPPLACKLGMCTWERPRR
jgi:hypothetical protein